MFSYKIPTPPSVHRGSVTSILSLSTSPQAWRVSTVRLILSILAVERPKTTFALTPMHLHSLLNLRDFPRQFLLKEKSVWCSCRILLAIASTSGVIALTISKNKYIEYHKEKQEILIPFHSNLLPLGLGKLISSPSQYSLVIHGQTWQKKPSSLCRQPRVFFPFSM